MYQWNTSYYIRYNNVNVQVLHQPPVQTMTADDEEILTLFLSLVSVEEGRKQREELIEGLIEGMVHVKQKRG